MCVLTLQYSRVNSLWKKRTMSQFTTPEIWEMHALLLVIYTGISKTNISGLLGINRRHCKGFWELHESGNSVMKKHLEFLEWNHQPEKEGPHQVPWRVSVILPQVDGCWKNLCLVTGLCNMPLKQVNLVNLSDNFWDITPYIWTPNTPDLYLLDYCASWALLSETMKPHINTNDEPKEWLNREKFFWKYYTFSNAVVNLVDESCFHYTIF